MRDHPPAALSISREDLAELPIRRFEGDIRLVTAAEDLDAALHDIRSERVVGFDTETRPSFRKGESHLPCLVQAATARAVYLFRPGADTVAALTELLEEPRIVKAGVALAHDLRSLALVFPFEARNVVELGAVARRAGIEQSGVRNLAGLLLGYRIPKGNRTSNWAARRLTPAQITYAATDAWVCRELFLKFESAGLF
ncbi:MAG TPA: 3'-5' exonuclease [Burkholderiales bacterium]|nr:3'-5' exonuclease [Burkholderiales bacterium]